MGDEEQRLKQEEHWRELAALLGVDEKGSTPVGKEPREELEARKPEPPPFAESREPAGRTEEESFPGSEEPLEEALAVAGKPAFEEGEREGRNRRGRQTVAEQTRTNEEEELALEEPSQEEEGEELEAETPSPETTEEEEDEVIPADWNVPSWNELIASLYRPDR